MAVALYADVNAWLAYTGSSGDAPSNVQALLRSASLAVRDATAMSTYTADPVTFLPTDPAIVAAFSDATCAQVDFLIAAGVDPTAGGTPDALVESSVGIGSARVTYSGADAAQAAKTSAVQGLCLDAARILRYAGLLSAVIRLG